MPQSTQNSRRRSLVFPGRFVFATALLALQAEAFSGSNNQQWRPSTLAQRDSTHEIAMTATFDKVSTSSIAASRPKPVVVSEEAEALSHSTTTMKLTPSYELFQMLTEEEGGTVPELTSGNCLRDGSVLKNGDEDTMEGEQLAEYKGLGGSRKIETLPDPFKMVEKELKPFADSISELVSSDQPILSMAAKHFFEKRHGKRFRPTIVQLVAKAVAAAEPEAILQDDGETFTSEFLLNKDPSDFEKTGGVAGWQWSGASKIDVEGGMITPENHKGSDVWRKQAQLGQIVEMIHVASLIHDDVLDEADTRRGGEAVHKLYSNKVAVLAGDYLLARASVLLARLENTAVVQIMATALESLVAGEIMQLKSAPETLLEMETYLRKSYYKTASLICYAARSTALLGGHAYGSTVATACEEFGFHLGLAYQIQDDILDFTAAATVLGKPALADMDLGLSTAPILYAAQEAPHLRPLVMRRFKQKGDKKAALEALYKSPTAMNKAKELAKFHAQRAVDALLRLPQSESRDALVRLTHAVVTRKK
ncbi:Probable solanesyl-diphosphate synthase 3, chloroplastic (Fragment) [Seminavis robusta]|uniref:Probable solanesyl-diphosphate synthase 3, chloroplastic n=1 Tax=Seminavis robusta TaxID=568900 RepID=A0A9N8DP67_9STRA